MAPSARRALAILTWGFVACLVVQLLLVGFLVFEAPVDEDLHRDFAYVYGWLAPIILVIAIWGGAPLRVRILSSALLVLYAIETFLPTMADEAPLLAATHAVIALVVFWVAVRLAQATREIPDLRGTPAR